jgi:hypothetical protein
MGEKMSFREFLPYTPADGNYFQLTLEEMINAAAGLAQVGVDGESMEPEYYQRAVVAANLVMLELQAQGLHLSSYNVGYLFLQPDQYEYVIENEKATNTYYETTLSAAEATGQTVLSVTSTDDFEVDDIVGVTLDDESLQWSTVSSIDTVLSTITIADALTDDAASGNYVFNYREVLKQISRIHQIWRRDNYVNDIPINVVGQQEYDALPYKTTSNGVPSIAYYHRAIPKGKLFLWPVPASSYPIMGFWYERKLGQLKDPTDVIDLDQFYYPAVVYTLALRLCDVFAASNDVYQRLKMTQAEMLAEALSYDDEQQPIKISPNRRV